MLMGRVMIRLADVPHFAKEEYHVDQVVLYSKFTELMFKALNLPSTAEFMDWLAGDLKVESVKVRVLRMPHTRSRVDLAQKNGKPHLIIEEYKGRFSIKRNLIDIYPSLFWPRRLMKPIWGIGVRSFILNSAIKGIIHEMLHQTGVRDEGKVKKLTDQYYKEFRRTSLNRFNNELKPLLKKWKKMEKELGLL